MAGVSPNFGWLQGYESFENKGGCEEMIEAYAPHIKEQVFLKTAGRGVIESFECMTREDWIEKNIELGHAVPEQLKMREMPKKIKGT